MRVFAISDLHLSTTAPKPMNVFGPVWTDHAEKIIADWEKKVTDDDIVLIAGDLSWAMQLDDAIKDLSTFAHLKGKKIFIRGNHDYWWKSVSRIRAALPENFFVLQNDAMRIENLVLTGTRGWTVEGASEFSEEDKKLYLRETERLRLCMNAVNKIRQEGDKTIVMMHYPPFNVRREDSLFTSLLEKNGVNAVVYGHLHGKECRTDLKTNRNGIDYYLTSCDQLGFKLAEITL